jgi:hypothetical protein
MARTTAKFHIQKLDDKPPVYERQEEVDAFWEQAPAGRYTDDIKRFHKEKSDRQRKMIFGHMIEQTILQANEQAIGVEELLEYLIERKDIPKGQPLTKDFLHELMYQICPTTDENGRRITLSKMDTLQANNLFERYRTILAPLGINIDDPNPERKQD